MKYAITGAAGNISKPLIKQLLNAGQSITVIGRDATHLLELSRLGADAAVGSVEDVEFLKQAFAGADAVYTMYPPNFTTPDIKEFIEQVAKNYAEAIKVNNIKYVVNLSAMGAHMAEKAGPISGLHRAEKILNALPGVNIKHLHPGYFYTNFFENINTIKYAGIIGSNFSMRRLPLADVADIATAVAEELLQLNFREHSDRYIVSDERDTGEIAAVLGAAIGKPDLQWIKFSNEQMLEGMMQAGLSKQLAVDYVEMLDAINGNELWKHYWNQRPVQFAPTKLEDFAKVFAGAYYASK